VLLFNFVMHCIISTIVVAFVINIYLSIHTMMLSFCMLIITLIMQITLFLSMSAMRSGAAVQ